MKESKPQKKKYRTADKWSDLEHQKFIQALRNFDVTYRNNGPNLLKVAE